LAHPGAERDLTNAIRFCFYKREAGAGVARRTYRLTGFPYSVIYRRIDSDIRVLVVRHQSRDPGHGERRA